MRALMFGAVVAALLVTSPATAQQAMPQMCPQMMQGNMMQGGMMLGFRHIEGQLAFLKTELKITEAQTPQWDAYAAARRANATRMQDLMSAMMKDGMMGQGMGMDEGMMNQGGMMMHHDALPLPDHLAFMEQHMSAHAEMMQAIKGPTLDLYGVLTPDQKRLADELLMGHMGMM